MNGTRRINWLGLGELIILINLNLGPGELTKAGTRRIIIKFNLWDQEN